MQDVMKIISQLSSIAKILTLIAIILKCVKDLPDSRFWSVFFLVTFWLIHQILIDIPPWFFIYDVIQTNQLIIT